MRAVSPMGPQTPQEKLLAGLERLIAERERQSPEEGRRRTSAVADIFNEALAEAIMDEAMRLGQRLTDLGILGEGVQSDVVLSPDGMPFEWWVEVVDGGEVRLYSWGGLDGVLVTRMGQNGRPEHATLDEHGVPIDWRVGNKRRRRADLS